MTWYKNNCVGKTTFSFSLDLNVKKSIKEKEWVQMDKTTTIYRE